MDGVRDSYEPIPDFYAGKSVFITGGAGYLGKVLIEKLLYSCPDVDKVYVLLRDKRNVSAENRLQNILYLPVFSRLRNKRPEDLKKIILMKGDISAQNLNLTADNLEIVKETVSVVIHSAASIKFNEPLKAALASNVEGTRNVLNLCRMMKNLEVYVHVSTAYCNSDKRVIEEQIYPPPASIEDAYRFAEEDHSEKEIKKFLKDQTPTRSRKLLLNIWTTHGDIPVVIIRPSIVTPSKDEPLKGWVDNWFGSSGLLTMIAKGVCRVVHTDDNHFIDLIPVDYVCNHTLVAAARTKRKPEVAVYNSCSGSSNPITIQQLNNLYCKAAVDINMNDLPYPQLMLLTRQYWLVWLITALSYMVAYLADFVGLFSMKRPRYVKLMTQSVSIRNVVTYFLLRNWIMKTDRSTALYETLSPSDAKTFPFLARDICWTEYIPTYVKGVKKYLIKKKMTK